MSQKGISYLVSGIPAVLFLGTALMVTACAPGPAVIHPHAYGAGHGVTVYYFLVRNVEQYRLSLAAFLADNPGVTCTAAGAPDTVICTDSAVSAQDGTKEP